MRKKYFILGLFFVLIFLNPVYAECQNSLDDYAVEVLLNKEDISYDIDLLKNAENVNYINKNFIIKSSSSDNVAIILSEISSPFCDNCISLRVQVPVNREIKEVSYFKFYTSLKNKNIVNFDKVGGWDSNCLISSCSFYKEGISVYIDNDIPSEVKLNIEIVGESNGCDGKIIYAPSKSFCITKENKEDIEFLLKTLKIINSSEELFLSYRIEDFGIKLRYSLSPQLEDNFFLFLQNQNLTSDTNESLENIRWDIVMDNELEWLRFNNIISINGKDMDEISDLAKLGFSGVNKRIYYGVNNEGNKQWGYYYQIPLPRLTKTKNCGDFSIKDIPKEIILVNYPTIKNVNLYYILPTVFSSLLLIVLFILIFISRKKIAKELKKQEKEIEKEELF